MAAKPGSGSPYARVLVAVDGSAPSLRAARTALGLARASRARLTAVMVVHLPLYADSPWISEIRDRLEGELRREAARVLSRVSDLGRREGVEVETRVLEGHAPTQILRFARKGKFDLLVAGSRGLSGADPALLGSVSGALVHRSKVSVLVVK